MKEAIHYLRKEIISRLTGSIVHDGNTVDIYNKIPNNATYPLIRVYSLGSNETDVNQSTYINRYTTRIEVITKYQSDNGGELDCNLIMNEVLQLVRNRQTPFDLSSDGFNVYTSTSGDVQYLSEETKSNSIYRGILELDNNIEQL